MLSKGDLAAVYSCLVGKCREGRASLSWEVKGYRRDRQDGTWEIPVRCKGNGNSLGGWSGVRTGIWNGAGISISGRGQNLNG